MGSPKQTNIQGVAAAKGLLGQNDQTHPKHIYITTYCKKQRLLTTYSKNNIYITINLQQRQHLYHNLQQKQTNKQKLKVRLHQGSKTAREDIPMKLAFSKPRICNKRLHFPKSPLTTQAQGMPVH